MVSFLGLRQPYRARNGRPLLGFRPPAKNQPCSASFCKRLSDIIAPLEKQPSERGMSLQPTSNWHTDLVAGLAVFFSMSYVVFANPIILSKAGMSPVPVFYGTCGIAALASFLSGYYAKAPAALAPGLALSAAIAQFLTSGETTMKWESALLVCAGAGGCLLLASLADVRRKVMDAIPRTIKLAVTGGIGAVLADNALKLVKDPVHPNHFSANLYLFYTGLVIIFGGYVILRGLSLRVNSPRLATTLDLVGRSSFFLSVPLLAGLAHYAYPEIIDKVGGQGTWLWLESTMTFSDAVRGAFRYDAIALFIFVLYILFADIVGSPYHMALDDHGYQHVARFEDEVETKIRKSFLVDSIANILAPIAGTSPVVFYAENFAGKVLGGVGAMVAYVSAILFLGLGLVGVLLGAEGKNIEFLVPGVAVAPALFLVGLIIISKALMPRATTTVATEPSGAATATIRGYVPIPKLWHQDFIELGFRLPAAIAIVVTPISGFEIGVAAGILSYTTFYLIVPKALSQHYEGEAGSLLVFSLIGALSVFFKLKL